MVSFPEVHPLSCMTYLTSLSTRLPTLAHLQCLLHLKNLQKLDLSLMHDTYDAGTWALRLDFPKLTSLRLHVHYCSATQETAYHAYVASQDMWLHGLGQWVGHILFAATGLQTLSLKRLPHSVLRQLHNTTPITRLSIARVDVPFTAPRNCLVGMPLQTHELPCLPTCLTQLVLRRTSISDERIAALMEDVMLLRVLSVVEEQHVKGRFLPSLNGHHSFTSLTILHCDAFKHTSLQLIQPTHALRAFTFAGGDAGWDWASRLTQLSRLSIDQGCRLYNFRDIVHSLSALSRLRLLQLRIAHDDATPSIQAALRPVIIQPYTSPAWKLA